ncbi:MAG: copper resistance system multicopper oxidase [Chromatiaceae bacterium]|nr:copper resistance system multicopper oxidase [Chromatiaceae bacterium]MCP5306993.1 copper resistance system multicopper oxidase [Chromatiaceae bacterium]MCP5423379.1 copper resistance system multicopper oxidase [Chromatiaceae bacterium]
MSKIVLPPRGGFSLSRRRFVQGLAAGGTLLGMGMSPRLGQADVLRARMGPQVLSGTRFDLAYGPTRVNFTGRERFATAINGSVPAPVLRWKEGDTVTLNVINNLADDTSIHWHGIILPSTQDGVPNISDGFTGIRPGETYTYRFPVKQSGTFWYHSHSGFQEQTGAYGAIVIDPREPEPFRYDREYVVQLSDWSDEDPHAIYAKLKKLSHYYNFRERTVGEAVDEIGNEGWSGFWANRGMWNEMRMSDRDISDVTGYTYTFLMNGVTPVEGWMGLFKRGERVRLRFINSSAMTFFDVRIPGLKMTVVAADGQYIEPVTVDEFRMGVAETYDVLVEPHDDRAYTVFAQAIDRSGYARGTLTPDPAVVAEVPGMDPAPILTHGDMGMAMEHAMPGMDGMDHSGHDMSSEDNSASAMGGMKCGAAMMSGTNRGGVDMADMRMPAKPMGSGPAGYGSAAPVNYDEVRMGPQIDMLADAAQYRLDDPGVGLRNNGRRVLTYADLFRLGNTDDPREPGREINLHLTGNMSRYMWSMNGIKFADAEPLQLKYGERVRINLINDTMMNHPIHLHGMWSDLETGDGNKIPRKHTVIVQPGAMISYLVTADAMGGWAYHCHLLYHMPGMFRKVVVS